MENWKFLIVVVTEMAKPVLVIGGGIAGIQAATDLADMGISVYLLESKPSLGGKMAQLDKTFPTNDCSTCILAPKISDCYNHNNVTTYTYSELEDVQGKKGDFTASITKKPRYVDIDACTGCGECTEKCPVTVEDEYNEGLATRGAVYKYQDQGVPNVVTIDPDNCLKLTKDKCGLCEKVCNFDAIRYDQKPEKIELEVASIIFAAGYDAFAGNIVSEYGYRSYENVITSLEYERILSASGPTDGHVVRPSDNREAKKIAYIHCTGSRDFRTDRNYCSSVCCMYSIKQALITKEHAKDADMDLYYMDIRSFGKGFERYFNRAEATEGINFIRSRVSDIEEENGDLILKTIDKKGKQREEKYDLVVLSVGLRPSPEISEMMKKLKIRVNKYGFADVEELDPLSTSRDGIYACGVITGPKDIPESVIQASAAAARAAEAAGVVPEKTKEDNEFAEQADDNEPEYRFTENEPIRIGVFVCHCGTNIAGVVDVKWVTEEAEKLPYVEHAEDIKYLCSSDSQDLISQRIREKKLNRVVIASCTPRTHLPLFRDAVARGGINPYLTLMTNIRDQDSWVHREEEEEATQKALGLVRGAVAKARKAYPLDRSKVDKINRAVVIGGGVSGMTAALELARMGYPVSLIEREEKLGGNANKLAISMDGKPVINFLDELKFDIASNPLIDMYLESKVKSIEGYVGNYNLIINTSEGEEEIEGGVIIVATGASELDTEEYLARESEKVISQLDLEQQIRNSTLELDEVGKIFMIQCVGSREEGREYCSRICCTQAVNNAIHLKERNPDLDINILYREMRTYGFYEDLYREARDMGVNFIRYEVEEKPKVKKNKDEQLMITYREPITGEKITENADLIVLAKAIVAEDKNNTELSKFLKVPLNEDKFFLEAHVKLRPVDFATDGVYLCGLAHGPKNLGESIAQSQAAASRAATVLAQDYLLTEAMVAKVDENICSGCGACEDVCAYSAVSINEETGKAEVNNVLCKGCGNCTGVCRPNAIDIQGFSHSQLLDEMDALYAGEGGIVYE